MHLSPILLARAIFLMPKWSVTAGFQFTGVEFGCKENFPLGDHVEAVIRPGRLFFARQEREKYKEKFIPPCSRERFMRLLFIPEKSEIVAQNGEAIEAGTKVGIDIKPQGIHVMPYNQNTQTFLGN